MADLGHLNHPDLSGGGPLDCGAFFLDVTGPYRCGELAVRWVDAARPRASAVETAIEEVWRQWSARASREGMRLFDGPLCRLIEYQHQNHQLSLTLGPTNYRAFVGTNLTNAHLRYTHGPEVMANPLGVSANLVVNGEYLVLGRRSKQVAYHAGRIQPVGGCVEPTGDGLAPDPFVTATTELREELGLEHLGPEQMTCLGLVRDKHIVQPELIFDVRTESTVEEIRQRHARAEHGSEHVELLAVRNHPARVVAFIESHYTQLTPVGLASLLLHGLSCWGSGWFATTRGYLRSLI